VVGKIHLVLDVQVAGGVRHVRTEEVADKIHLVLGVQMADGVRHVQAEEVAGSFHYSQVEEVVGKSRKVLEVSVTHVVADDDVD
jgi:hypothetical protein